MIFILRSLRFCFNKLLYRGKIFVQRLLIKDSRHVCANPVLDEQLSVFKTFELDSVFLLLV